MKYEKKMGGGDESLKKLLSEKGEGKNVKRDVFVDLEKKVVDEVSNGK
jgi:hypothetical protein